jgi:hypothetical protein
MKTNIIKTATLILAVVITTSVEAQNTKSFKENRFTGKLTRMVKENMVSISNGLNQLKSTVQYQPQANFDYEGIVENQVVDCSELESLVRFTPDAKAEYNSYNVSNEFTSVLDELKSIVKYTPETEKIQIELMVSNITNELAAVVKYNPQS